ncbi:hypothetical protein [Kingella sp. (in: b-proteobacteria)]|uniref:hypothetical protein n=1 Tax=Kingella sp. (in: b-proteobacteria) TaxID=2020713 RepID=UPI0026DC3CB5|nr:hypothetical protein [Kingella sp. (in: b-proteobacteria)]MDO4657997.1 hypothetical protein [Kingella sp. (in: b-proteobacteria)]
MGVWQIRQPENGGAVGWARELPNFQAAFWITQLRHKQECSHKLRQPETLFPVSGCLMCCHQYFTPLCNATIPALKL